MHTEGKDWGRDTADSSTPGDQFDAEHPGYETTDVNVGGVVVFLGGLAGFLVMFFVVCYLFGIVINGLWNRQDGAPTKWKVAAGEVPPGKGKNLATNPELQSYDQRIINNFPQPRLDIDDSNQSLADLHAREDLLLGYYSTDDKQPGTVRIPITRAMELIAQRGLPVTAPTAQPAGQLMAGDAKPEVTEPLTTGFARTGYEITVIEAREQKLNYTAAAAEMPTSKSNK